MEDNVQYHSMIVPVAVHHEDTGIQVDTYAMLDNQSNACFMSEDLASKLHVPKDPTKLQLTTMLSKETVSSNTVKGLVVKGVGQDSEIHLPVTYTRASIPASNNLIPKPETVQQWPHMKDVKIPAYKEGLSIDLLIGFNCLPALVPKEMKAGADDEPFAVRTNLGWGVTGLVNRRSADNDSHTFTYRTSAEELVSPQAVRDVVVVDKVQPSEDKKSAAKEDLQQIQSGEKLKPNVTLIISKKTAAPIAATSIKSNQQKLFERSSWSRAESVCLEERRRLKKIKCPTERGAVKKRSQKRSSGGSSSSQISSGVGCGRSSGLHSRNASSGLWFKDTTHHDHRVCESPRCTRPYEHFIDHSMSDHVLKSRMKMQSAEYRQASRAAGHPAKTGDPRRGASVKPVKC